MRAGCAAAPRAAQVDFLAPDGIFNAHFEHASLFMSTTLDPRISEFETQEQADSYAAWLRAKVAASLADPRPAVPHDEVMAEMDALIDQIEARNKTR